MIRRPDGDRDGRRHVGPGLAAVALVNFKFSEVCLSRRGAHPRLPGRVRRAHFDSVTVGDSLARGLPVAGR